MDTLKRQRASATKRHRDFEMMADPSRWPLHAFLPITRFSGSGRVPELGVLYDSVGHRGIDALRLTVFLVNVCDLAYTIRCVAQLIQRPHIAYQTLDAVLADGWEVD